MSAGLPDLRSPVHCPTWFVAEFSKVRDTKDSGNDSDSAAEDAKKLEFFNVMGRSVPLKNTPHGLCALKVAKHDAKPVSHKAALGYVFPVGAAMASLVV